ncbi:MAG: DUF1800 domain-containing protein [Rubrivivax sp.]|nr:MAG: DUF1800 domain-containing protein [Rubrivivax sp.]
MLAYRTIWNMSGRVVGLPIVPPVDVFPAKREPMIRHFKRSVLMCVVLAASLSLSGCLEPAAPAEPPTPETAARFLTQTTFGPTPTDIDHLVAVGYEAWLTEQFASTPADTHFNYVDRGGPPDCYYCNAEDVWAAIDSFWYQSISGKDQLRQRVAFSFLELFVVSAATDGVLFHEASGLASYMDMLSAKAFGNYRDLLEAVTLSPTMGHYLSHLQNEKEDPVTGRLPDENYAREVMQLFTIGKWKLNSDGTREKDANGNDVPAYTQEEVMGLARALTGWSWGGPDTDETRWRGDLLGGARTRVWNLPMQAYDQYHSQLEKKLVGGVTIPAGTPTRESLKIALDTLFNHPNTPPFIATHLIKRLVTSNPSPAYVQRVANVFVSNREGVRGDMRAVVRAVLFDPEVWDGSYLTSPTWGKAKEPVIKMASLVRAFSCKASSGVYKLSTLQDAEYDVGQPVLMANSVFNFFQPDFAPQGEIAAAGLVAPDFQMIDNYTLPGFLNIAQNLIDYGIFGGTNLNTLNCDYSKYTAVANDPAQLTQQLAKGLMGYALQPSVQALITQAVAGMPLDTTAASRQNRVKAALMMMVASPDFNIQR